LIHNFSKTFLWTTKKNGIKIRYHNCKRSIVVAWIFISNFQVRQIIFSAHKNFLEVSFPSEFQECRRDQSYPAGS
jgi:hypothetical protein